MEKLVKMGRMDFLEKLEDRVFQVLKERKVPQRHLNPDPADVPSRKV